MISPGLSSCEHSLNTLRYADRVKGLAASDPTENKISPADENDDYPVGDHLNDSDLAQLRSMNVNSKPIRFSNGFTVFFFYF